VTDKDDDKAVGRSSGLLPDWKLQLLESFPSLPSISTETDPRYLEMAIARRMSADAAMRVASGAMKAVRDQGYGFAAYGVESLGKFWRGLPRQARVETYHSTLWGWRKIAEAADRLVAGARAKDCPDTGAFDQALQDLMCQKPSNVTIDEWAVSIRDGAEFIGVWGNKAFQCGWPANDIFGVPHQDGGRWSSGIAWILAGRRVQSVGANFARIGHGDTVFCRRTRAELSNNPFGPPGFAQ
jgi:hypothetical protein